MAAVLIPNFTLMVHELHLGHTFSPNMRKAMVKDMCHDFIWLLNSLSANFGFCNISTKRYKTSIIYVVLYLILWCMSLEQDKHVDEFHTTWREGVRKHVDEFHTTWREGVRKLFNLLGYTDCNMRPHLMPRPSVI